MKCVTQGFHAAHSPMRFGVHPALIEHRRGSSQSLQEAFLLVAGAIIPDFCQQSWSQSLSCTRQALKNRMVLMGQKKGVDLLGVLSNLLDKWHQLTYQHQHQARFGPRDHGIGLQMELMHPLENLERDWMRMRLLGLFEHVLDLFQRGTHRLLWSGIGLQEQQG